MTLPAQTLTVLDPGLGLVAPAPNSPIYTGPAAGGTGTVNTLYSFSRLNDVRGTLGYGQLAEDVADVLSNVGGPVYAMITAGTVAATTSAVTHTGTGTALITLSGTPGDTYTGVIQIIGGGALGVGTFRYALDAHSVGGGQYNASPTWSAVRTIPSGGTFVAGSSGITFTFDSGTYVAGDSNAFTTLQATPNSSDLSAAAAVIQATYSALFPLWILSATFAAATDAATMATALSGQLTTLATNFRYARGICDIGSGDTEANVLTSRATWSSRRIVPCYGYCLSASALPYEGFGTRKTSCAGPLATRAARVLISTDLARFAEGPLESVTGIDFDGFSDPTLDNDQIATLRTWPGVGGFYVAKARLASNPPSDFTDLHFGRIMDQACATAYAAQQPFIAEGFRTVASPAGAIDPLDQADVETAVQAALNASLLQPKNARGRPGHVSAVSYTVDGTNNLASTQTLNTEVAVRPLGYANFINTQLGFSLNA